MFGTSYVHGENRQGVFASCGFETTIANDTSSSRTDRIIISLTECTQDPLLLPVVGNLILMTDLSLEELVVCF